MGIRSLFGSLREKIVGKNLKIVFPEGMMNVFFVQPLV